MEHKIEILVAGTNDKILATIVRLLNKNKDWNATGVSSVVAAVDSCREKLYHVVLIGAGLTDQQEKELAIEVRQSNPEIHVIPHYGGGSGLLFAELYLALGTINQAQ